MRCHVCNVAVGDDQKFCHECGVALAAANDPGDEPDDEPGENTNDEVMFAPPPAPGDDLADTGPIDVIPASPTPGLDDDGLEPTEAMAVTPPLAPETTPSTTSETPKTAATSSLDSIPWQQPDAAAQEVTHERTTAMPVAGAHPGDPGATDTVPQSGPGGVGST